MGFDLGEGNPSANARGVPLPQAPTPPQRVLLGWMGESGNADGVSGMAVPRLCGGRDGPPVFFSIDRKKKVILRQSASVPDSGTGALLRREWGSSKEKYWRELVSCFVTPSNPSTSPGDGKQRKAPASPGCYIDQNKARLGEGGGSLRGEGTPFARQRKGVPSPLNQKKQKTFHKKLDEQGLPA